MNGELLQMPGYATTVITNLALAWLDERDAQRPFFMMLHHKAPHRNWVPDQKHAHLYEDNEIPYPATFDDDYATRSQAAKNAWMRMEHLTDIDTKGPPPSGLTEDEVRRWKYQRFIKDYLRCIASVDDNVGRVLDYLDAEGLTEDTIVIYTSDQGFFLGDHGWFDKRFMYEESLRMPFLMRYPREIPAGQRQETMITNLDFAPTWLDYAGLPTSQRMQGRSFREVVASPTVSSDWPESMYYRYWMHGEPEHNVAAHYGIRTRRYKLIYYYGNGLDTANYNRGEPTTPEWELFDLEQDPAELRNVYADPAYAETVAELTQELHRLQAVAGDSPFVPGA